MIPKPLLLCACLLLAAALFPRSAAAVPLVISGPAGAEVRLNDRFIGFLPLDGPLDVPADDYVLHCDLPGHQPYVSSFRLLNDQSGQRVVVRMVPLSRRTAVLGDLMLAGLGQRYAGQRVRGWTYTALEVGGIVTALTGELQRSNHRKDYLLLMDDYAMAINADRIAYYRAEAQRAWDDMEDAEKLRDTGLLVAGGAVLLSVLDSLAFLPGVEAGAGMPQTAWSPSEGPAHWTGPACHVGFKASF